MSNAQVSAVAVRKPLEEVPANVDTAALHLSSSPAVNSKPHPDHLAAVSANLDTAKQKARDARVHQPAAKKAKKRHSVEADHEGSSHVERDSSWGTWEILWVISPASD